ncbi:hypothetical protein QPL79_07455 [Ignisphaera sp. 4213-co]|uniref:Restriction endonuclease type IV Mrr domain-containing protein n=1 Tax=Ignisphaera cupida TaxID=3050454 RepID=A0ABD4Z775_9CREN|nr:hypothetical protein [Ignisphaera sp. 4213-co]MDK6029197.1 hypothetical protein [Ignisphaera sp. 4213-co]
MSHRSEFHGRVVEIIEAILRHYGFSVQREYRLPTGERIDLVGQKDSLTIAVEVSITSDLAKDIDKLSKFNADLKFIVVVKPYEIPTINGIYIVDLEGFEPRLRKLLKVPLDYPPALASLPPLPPLSSLDEFENVLEGLGIKEFVEPALKLLLKAHLMGGQVPTRFVYWPYPLEKPIVERMLEDPRVINLLVTLGLAHDEYGIHGNYQEGKVFGITLTDKGVSLAKAYEKHLVNEHRYEIVNVVKSKPLISFITALACLRGASLVYPPKRNYVDALAHVGFLLAIRDIDRVSELPYPSELIYFCISAFNLPKIHNEGVKTLKDLERTGLVLISPYDFKGRACEDSCIYASTELLKFICNSLYKDSVAKLEESGIPKN